MRLILLILLIALVTAQNKFSPKCKKDSDCDPMNHCNEEVGKCVHKDLMPLSGQEVAGTILVFLMSALSNAGGIGGSSIMIAFLLLIFNFETHMVIPIVQVIIMSGSIIAVFLKFKSRHPARDRPLIFYDILMLEVAPLLLGSSIGVFLNIGFPTWLILAILILVTLTLAIITFHKGYVYYKKETKIKRVSTIMKVTHQDTVEIDTIEFKAENKNDELEIIEPDDELEKDQDNFEHEEENSQNQLEYGKKRHASFVIVEEETGRPIRDIHSELQEIYKEEGKVYYPFHIFIICAIYAWAILAAFFRGDTNVKSIGGWELCSDQYWGFVGGFIVSMILIGLILARHLNRQTHHKLELGYDYDAHDLRWHFKESIMLMCFSFIAGFTSGLIGISGGVIMGPVQLAFGIRPEVSAATSSVIVVLTSSLNFILFLKAGMVTENYSLWLMAFSVIGSAAGILIVKKIVEKQKRPSIIVFCLGTVYICAFLLILAYGIRKMYKEEEKGTAKYGFQPFC
ncbi:unnamed protein product [Blepharisma stoltei]|uniref:Sulfite exporter TauE/SafE family protein n=1 Tax=Blepharisma stoltei TaxID=1481888 RepID=A0AAU9JL68_9CILI|nr:unnamed protein product [Blepharisma stoltei]